MDDDEFRVVLKSIEKLFKKWRLSPEQKYTILGGRYLNECNGSDEDIIERISLILNIHSSLRMRFNNPLNVYGYINMFNKNSPFNGSRPIDFCCKGIDELRQTMQAISQLFDSDVVQPEINTLDIEKEKNKWSPER